MPSLMELDAFNVLNQYFKLVFVTLKETPAEFHLKKSWLTRRRAWTTVTVLQLFLSTLSSQRVFLWMRLPATVHMSNIVQAVSWLPALRWLRELLGVTHYKQVKRNCPCVWERLFLSQTKGKLPVTVSKHSSLHGRWHCYRENSSLVKLFGCLCVWDTFSIMCHMFRSLPRARGCVELLVINDLFHTQH